MHPRFIVRLIAGLGSLTLAFEAIGAESPGPDLSTLPSNSRTSYSSREVNQQAAAYYNRAIVYATKRNYKLAIRDSTTAIQLRPKFANAYHNRGAFHADIGEFDKAIADYSEAIRFNPRSASTFANRALAYRNIEKSDKAMADYYQVLQITPKDAEDYSARGSAYFAKDDYKAAASSFRRALQLSPKNHSALGGLAWVRATSPEAALRDGKEAVRMSTGACELSKWSEQDHIQALAAAYAESGDFDKAMKYQTSNQYEERVRSASRRSA